jgi:UDP-glucose 4-epimerase
VLLAGSGLPERQLFAESPPHPGASSQAATRGASEMKIDGSKILVIGGAGLVGSHIVEQLTQTKVTEIRILDNFSRGTYDNIAVAMKDPRVRVIEGDITNVAGFDEWMKDIDYVFHLAALWLLQCVETPRVGLEINAIGTFNVLEACHRNKIKKLVFSSSASVYGDAESVPMTERHPFHNRTMYGATKVAGEQFCRAFYEMYKLDYVGLRYMNIYGPRQDYHGAYVSVIMKVLDRLDQGLQPVIYGDGSQSYDFIYVGDVARANIQALESDATDDFFNVGMGIKTTINELVHELLDLTGKTDVKPEYRPQEQIFVTHRVGSIDHAEKKLGFQAKTQLREGLQRLIQWRKDQMAREAVGSTAH